MHSLLSFCITGQYFVQSSMSLLLSFFPSYSPVDRNSVHFIYLFLTSAEGRMKYCYVWNYMPSFHLKFCNWFGSSCTSIKIIWCCWFKGLRSGCSVATRTAILFVKCQARGKKKRQTLCLVPIMVASGTEVGIRPSLSSCWMPLIRWLASALQWAHWKVFDNPWMKAVCSSAAAKLG